MKEKELGKVMYGSNLFGEAAIPEVTSPVAEKFLFPPFSVLDARSGAWQNRKKAWLRTGIKSELGRGEDLTYNGHMKYINYYKEKEAGKDPTSDPSKSMGTSIFDPVLCECIYRWFCPPGGQILDPFAGGSVRGIVAGLLHRKYWGCDLSSQQIEANKEQCNEIIGTRYYTVDELTPVQNVDGYYLKRDDLCSIYGARGGKARTCYALSKKAQHSKGLTTAGSRQSPQVLLVATMAQAMGLPCVAHVPDGDISNGSVAEAKALGATIIQHRGRYNSVIEQRAREYANEHNFTQIPFGMVCDTAVEQTRKQVANIPRSIKRIVVPVGSGMSLSGILWGLRDYDIEIPVTGICVGADPTKRLDTYAPQNWRETVTLINSPTKYHDYVTATIGSVLLDPIYEAKCYPYIERGDLLWIVGTRENVNPHVPQWVSGDSNEMLEYAPKADLVFSCPPYGDLEVYSDAPDDLSNMSWEEFREGYREIIKKAVDKMKENSFACFVVGDYRDKDGYFRNFVSETISAFQDAGAKLYNEGILVTAVASASMRVTRQFMAGRKFAKTHQNVLIFVKGDWRKASEKMKEDIE